jgi:regulation of enolase protein 1 (concanavalin A-like superfamily)
MGGMSLHSASAAPPSPSPTFTPQNDDWKGTTLDLTKWHPTVLGDAQTETNGIAVNDGTIKITAGGFDFWNDNDNGMFLWQPANGDFQATIEVRTLKMLDSNTDTMCGIMVRPSTDFHSPHVMLKTRIDGTHIQYRANVGDQAGPSSAGRLPWGNNDGTGPTMQLRLTRTGDMFKGERSLDGGKTWGSLHDAADAANDMVQVPMPDDVLVGIAVSAVDATTGATDSTEAVLGPFTFTQTAARPTTNGLIAVTAVDSKMAPVTDAVLIVKDSTGKVVGTTMNDVTTPATSDTGSFFLPPGTYTVETGETSMFAASVPTPFEVKTGQVQDLLIPVGKAK